MPFSTAQIFFFQRAISSVPSFSIAVSCAHVVSADMEAPVRAPDTRVENFVLVVEEMNAPRLAVQRSL